MILLKSDYDSLKDLKGTERWAYLFAIADIYMTYSAETYPKEKRDLYDPHPLLDTEVVEILKTRYNLVIRRQTIETYRKKLEEYFEYNFERNKKGWYLSYVNDDRMNDERLLLLAIVFYNNSSLSYDDTKDMLDNIAELTISKKVKKIIDNISSIKLIDRSEVIDNSYLPEKISIIMEAIESGQMIQFNYLDRIIKKEKYSYFAFYPRFLFVKNNILYLFCSRIAEREKQIWFSSEWIWRLDSMTGIKIKESKTQLIIDKEKYRRYNNIETHTDIDIVRFLNSSTDVSEGRQESWDLTILNASFKLIAHPYYDTLIASRLKNKYGSNIAFDIDKVDVGIYKDHQSVKMDAPVAFKIEATKEEIFDLAFRYSKDVKLLAPQELVDEFKTRISEISNKY